MKIALGQTTSFWTGQSPVAVEPANLLGMHNQLKAAGHDAELLHNRNRWNNWLVEQIDEFAPEIIGLSAVDMLPRNGAGRWAETIFRFKASGARVILGGKGPTFNPHQYAHEIQPDVIVIGPGEPIMSDFIDYEFDWNELKNTPIFKGMAGGTMLFGLDLCDFKKTSLDSVGYERDYDLAEYGNMAWPLLQVGCLHQCIFCPGDLPVSYKSPEFAVEEIRYLIMQKGARIIWPFGADFTASAGKSAAIVGALADQDFTSDTIFRFGVRMDSFWRSVQRYGREWERFAASVPHIRLNTGIESFLGKRRWRMGKDFSEERSMNHTDVVDSVLAWAQKMGNVDVEGSFIMIDPESTLAEFYNELDEIEWRVLNADGHLRVVRGTLHNTFTATVGTPSIEMYPPPAEDRKYRKDPRLTLLNLYMTNALYRDYRDALASADGDHVKEDLFLIDRLREIAKRIEKKINSGNLSATYGRVMLQMRRGDSSFFDED